MWLFKRVWCFSRDVFHCLLLLALVISFPLMKWELLTLVIRRDPN